MVCRLVLADGRGVLATRPHAADVSSAVRRTDCRHRAVWPRASSSSIGNWSSPMSSRRSGAGSMRMIGNPPWDVMKPNSQEFFTDFDPLYRTYDKQAALRRQKELLRPWLQSWPTNGTSTMPGSRLLGIGRGTWLEPFDLALATGQGRCGLSTQSWAKHGARFRVRLRRREHPFRLPGSADLNSYKMFAEVFWTSFEEPMAASA